MNVALPTVSAGLVGKSNDLLLGPVLVSRQNGQCGALEAVVFGLGLEPGTDFLLYDEVSTGLLLTEDKSGEELTR